MNQDIDFLASNTAGIYELLARKEFEQQQSIQISQSTKNATLNLIDLKKG